MIHNDLQPPPPPRAQCTFNSRWSRYASQNWLLGGFCFSLCLSVPTDPGTDRRRGLSCSQRLMRQTGRKGGGLRALKFLMSSLVFSLLNLHTSCLWAGWNNQAHHATHRQAATPGTATHFGVPSQPACSQTLFFWRYEKFYTPPFIFSPLPLFRFN